MKGKTNMNGAELLQFVAGIKTGKVSEEEITGLIKDHCGSEVADILREYLLTGNMAILDTIDEKMAVKFWLYHQNIINSLIMHDGEVVTAKDLNRIVYDREWIPGLHIMRWDDKVVQRIKIAENQYTEVPAFAPQNIGVLQLVAESEEKSFYFKTIPELFKEWLNSKQAQKISDLATLLKRPGKEVPAWLFRKIRLAKKKLRSKKMKYSDVYDMGVLILTDEEFRALMDYIGSKSWSPLQMSLVGTGIYFKGEVTCESLSGMECGFYGGIKVANKSKDYDEEVILASVMDSFVHVPWTPSFNRQQADYAGIKFPFRFKMPEPETVAKALSGLPSYTIMYNQELMSRSKDMMNRIEVEGYAGKISIGVTDKPAHFIIRGNKFKYGEKDGEIRKGVALFNPSLPVYTYLPLVDVLFVYDDRIDGHLIQVNMHDSNLEWVDKYYIALFGRDADGDGMTISFDPLFWTKEFQSKVVECSELDWIDTTQYKSNPDKLCTNHLEAIRLATYRIRVSSHLVGKYDKISRRVIYYDPKLMTWKFRVKLTEAIQRSISAQKKNSGAEKFASTSWIVKEGFVSKEEMNLIYKKDGELSDETKVPVNAHDLIDLTKDNISLYLDKGMKFRIAKNKVGRGTATEQDLELAESGEQELLDIKMDIAVLVGKVGVKMSDLEELLVTNFDMLLDDINVGNEVSNELYTRAQAMYAVGIAQKGRDATVDINKALLEAKKIWGSVTRGNSDNDYHGLSYTTAARIIRFKVYELIQKYGKNLVLGAAIASQSRFSEALIGKILKIEDLADFGIDQFMYVPVVRTSLNKGEVLNRQKINAMITNKRLLEAVDGNRKFEVVGAFKYNGINWNTGTRKNKQSAYMLKLKLTAIN